MMSTSLKVGCWGWTDGRWRSEGGVEGIKGVKGRSCGSIGALRALWGASYDRIYERCLPMSLHLS